MNYILLILFSLLYHVQSQSVVQCDLTSETLYTNGGSGGNGDCGTSLQEGATCTPVCGTGFEIDNGQVATCDVSNGVVVFTAAVCKATTCLNVDTTYTNGNAGECTATMAFNATCSIECDTGYEATGGVNGQTKCNGGTNVNYAQCTDINECEETSGTIDYLSHQFTDGVCGLNGGCVNKDIVNDGVHFICQCNTGYNGTYCNNNIDDCHGQPCYTGTCTDGVADYTCTCLDGWTGDDCDTGTDCITHVPSTQCSDKTVSFRPTGSPTTNTFYLGGVQGTYGLTRTECELQPLWSNGFYSAVAPKGCILYQNKVYFNTNTDSDKSCSSGAKCVERCYDNLETYVRLLYNVIGENKDPNGLFDGTPGIFSLNKEECLALDDAEDWSSYNTANFMPHGCSLATNKNTDDVLHPVYNDNINSDAECDATWWNYKFKCIERYQFELPHGPIANGNSNNCTDINHNEYCRIQCNPGYYIINGIGGNDLCWAGGFTGQSEFGNTYQNSSCAACPTGRYTTQLNSVTQCNTFSYYIDGSDRDGDAGTLCADGNHFIAGDNQTDSQCIQCSAGTYSTGGDACSVCTDGKQAQNSNNNNEYSSGGASYCVACKDGSDNQDGSECDRCPVGEYSVNGASCSVCGDGKQAQLSTVDNVFATLNDIFTEHTTGSPDNSMNESECKNYAGTGFYSSDSWGHIPYGCVRQKSTGNTYWNSNTNSQVGCAGGAYGACVKKTSSGGAPYCVTCADGYDNQDNGICDACPIGQNSTGGEECTSCPKGTQTQMNNDDNVFNTGTGSPYCVTCEAGKDNEDGGECDPCPSGLISMNGAKCGTCPTTTQSQVLNTGHVYSSSGAIYCVTCDVGYDNEDGDECDACADGLVSINGATCGTCPVGTQSQALNTGNEYNSSGALYCVTCADGYDNQDGNACEACPIGEYSIGGANCSVCADGKQAQASDSDNVFINSAATKCITCADGYDNQNGNACDACPEGEYSVGGANCSVCTDGKQAQTSDINTIFVNSAATKCITCADGYYNQDGDACDACPIGEYSVNGDNCHVCDDGKQAQLSTVDNVFNNGTGSPYCVACADGYDNQNGNVCDACPEGEYSVGGANCSVCTDGKQAQTSDSDNVFVNSAATKCVTCIDGYDNQDGNACDACPIGEYSTNGDNCHICDDGKQAQLLDTGNVFNNGTGSPYCVACQDGYDNDCDICAKCEPCTEGEYSVGGANCSVCTDGKQAQLLDTGNVFVNSAATKCIACADGYDNQNGDVCDACPIGTYSTGGVDCITCPVGRFTTDTNSTSCDMCPPGRYMQQSSSTREEADCIPCAAGYYSGVSGLNDLENANPCNACPLGTWSPTFDSTDTDNPNHPNPPSAESHCRSCPAGTKGVTTALESESECTSCDPGDESSEPNPTHCTQCDIGTFSEGREICRTCPDDTYQPEEGQDECLTTISACNPGQEVIVGNATHPATCLNCNASYHYSPDGIACRGKKTSCMKGFGIYPSGNAIEDDSCTDIYEYELSEPEESELNELYWRTMSIYCAKRGKFALLTNGKLVCAPCSNKLFLYEYEMSNDYVDVSSLPASQRATRHGKCCVNPHHKVCVKMMDEFHKNCKAELKGTTQVQLQPCDIDPTGDGCPPYIDGPSVLDLYNDEKLEQMITFYNCFNGQGGSSYDWIDIYGSIAYGVTDTYYIHLSCTEERHGGEIDAVPLPVMVKVIDRPTGVHKVVTFDNQQHDACSYDTIEVNWNGNDMNLYEVDEDGYNTCSGGLIGDEIESEMNSVHTQVYVIGPDVGQYRYYVANNIISAGGTSTTPCAEYGKKFKIYCPIPLNRGTTGIPLVPVNNTLN